MRLARERPSSPGGTHSRKDLQSKIRRVIAPWVIGARYFKKYTVPYGSDARKSIDVDDFTSLGQGQLSFARDSSDFVHLMKETSNILKVVTKAASVSIYKVDARASEIFLYTDSIQPIGRFERFRVRWKIEEKTTVAAYVAKTKEYVLVNDIYVDARFPEGIDYEGSEHVKSVLAVPILGLNGECYAVVELYRTVNDKPFTTEQLKIVIMITGWMGAAIHQDFERETLQRQIELNEYLITLMKRFFSRSISSSNMIFELIKAAMIMMGAERGAIFLLDENENDLVGELMEEECADGIGEPQLIIKDVRIRKDAGIPGIVLKSGVPINVLDAYDDERFTKEIDEKTGFITRAVLCNPLISSEGIIGVVQVVNKTNGGSFTSSDELLFRTFTSYFSITHHFRATRKQFRYEKMVNKWYLLMFKYHGKACIHNRLYMKNNFKHIVLPFDFHDINWYVHPDQKQKMPLYAVAIFITILGVSEIEISGLINFILAVKEFHNNKNLYHNFEHALHVLHAIYLVLNENLNNFTMLELKAMLIAAICHDIEHPGRTSTDLLLENDDLVKLYDKSPFKKRACYITFRLLDQYHIFPNWIHQRDELMNEVKGNILGMNRTFFYQIRDILLPILSTNPSQFDWKNKAHRRLCMVIMLISADAADQCKKYSVAKSIAMKRLQEMHYFKIPADNKEVCTLNDSVYSERNNRLPKIHVQYINNFVLPIVDLLRLLLPNTLYIYANVLVVSKDWAQVIINYGRKMWRPHDSFVHKH